MLAFAMTLEDAARWAQVIIAAGTLGVVIASVIGVMATLREVQRDREERQRPYILFDQQGTRVKVKELDSAVTKAPNGSLLWSNLPPGDKPLGADQSPYGKCRNVGNGPAFGIHVLWIAGMIRIGRDEFNTEGDDRKEPYTDEFNDLTLHPRNLAPGEDGRLVRLPGFIAYDVDRKLAEVSGILHIYYGDMAGKEYITQQRFRLWTAYEDDPPFMHITFEDVVGASPSQGG